MRYQLYIKSHDEAPDYEVEGEFSSKETAIKEFTDQINRNSFDDWREEEIALHVFELPK